MRKPVVFSIQILLCLAGALFGGEPWGVEDLLQVKWVGSGRLSPDGQWLAYQVYGARTGPEQSEYGSQIHLSRVDGSMHRQLTQGSESCFSPAWSPDGQRLAFLSARDSKAVQLWSIPFNGGEARPLTDTETGVIGYEWSPDGSAIAFTSPDPPTEEEKQAIKAKTDVEVVDTGFHQIHLYTLAVGEPGTRPKPQPVTSGDFSIYSFDWAPDGSGFVVTHMPTPRKREWRNTDISTVSAAGGPLKPLVRREGMDMGAKFSPDGATVAFVSDRLDRTWARHWRICLVPTEGGEEKVLPPTFDEMPGEFIDAGVAGWSADGSGVYYVEYHHTDIQLFLMPLDGSRFRRITAMPGSKFDFRIDTRLRMVSFEMDSFTQPPELYVQNLEGDARQVTEVNRELPKRDFAKSEILKWKSFDGLEIEGILHYPLSYEQGRRYPLLVELHGGPTYLFVQEFTAQPWNMAQLFTAQGFALLQVNPRGSAGYGKAFRFANLCDWGGKDVRDVLAGVDHLIDRGLADGARLGVFGWSYGGFLTSMTISRSKRFKAAMVGMGPTNLISGAGTMDIPGFIPSFMASEPWQEPELWMDHSAVFHAGEIDTPTLLIYAEKDARVPVGQGHELYRALHRRGVETQLVIYPRSTHFDWEPKQRLDIARRLLEWFQAHL